MTSSLTGTSLSSPPATWPAADRQRAVTVTTTLLVPAGVLVVVDTWQPIYLDDDQEISGRAAAWWLTLRTPHLNGELIWRSPATRDLLDSAADVIDGGLRARTLRHTPPGLVVNGTLRARPIGLHRPGLRYRADHAAPDGTTGADVDGRAGL